MELVQVFDFGTGAMRPNADLWGRRPSLDILRPNEAAAALIAEHMLALQAYFRASPSLAG